MPRGSTGGQTQRAPNSRSQQTAGGSDPHHGAPAQQRGNPNRTTGDSRPDRGVAGNADNTTLQAIAAVFALLGALSLYAGLEALRLSGAVPMVGSGLRALGLVVLMLGVAYLYAAHGVWTRKRRGWQVGMWLAAAGALVCLAGLLSGGTAGAVFGLAFNAGLGWGLHTNREPFRDHPLGETAALGTASRGHTGGRQTTDSHTRGYASERRGRH